MDNDQIDDFKQFMTSLISQAEARLGERIGGVETKVDNLETKVDNLETKVDNLETKVDNLRQEMHEGFAGVGDAFAPANDQLENHEKRIVKLEQRTI